ncbi:efflux RND transporter periplasmic adaptor subunit [Zhongshania sp.]|uniref:efflux RND transporter periplasmic adaptor subunit n=1 Tax=Zhongshania sp. TaxID=1971902 RepID=UPI00356575B9
MKRFYTAAALICLANFLNGAAQAETRLHPVSHLTIEEQESYEAQRLFAGRVIGSQRAEIGFELAGQVLSVSVKDGERVEAGQLLASLDTRGLQIEQTELNAARVEVSARLAQIDKDLIRFQALRDKSYVSEGQLETLNSNRQATAAQLAQVESKLKGVALRLQKSKLTAPFAGEIAGMQLEAGVLVAAGQPLMQIVQSSRSEAVFGISDQLGRNLVVGQPLSVFGDFGQWQANLISVSQNLDWRTQTRTVRVSLPVEAPAVDGNTAYLLLPETRPVEGFWLPLQALLEDVRGTWAVYQLAPTEDGVFQLKKRSVQVIYQFEDQVYLSGGLRSGDRVVSAGIHRLAPELHVSLAQE